MAITQDGVELGVQISELAAQKIKYFAQKDGLEDNVGVRVHDVSTVRQIAETLGAHWVQEPVNLDAPVQQFLIGGNIMDSGGGLGS